MMPGVVSVAVAAAMIGAAMAIAATPAAPTMASVPAGAVQLCTGYPPVALQDDRLLGHIGYAEAVAADLVDAPAGFRTAHCAKVDRELLPALDRLIAAAKSENPAVGRAMLGVSCFRAIERQRGLFCSPAKLAQRGLAGEAKWIAPPAFSEHATGFAIDFGDRTRSKCNADPCFLGSPVQMWLAANAHRFGFELSFPKDNRQGVSYEPWHWRWVGSDRARARFARARRDFPSP